MKSLLDQAHDLGIRALGYFCSKWPRPPSCSNFCPCSGVCSPSGRFRDTRPQWRVVRYSFQETVAIQFLHSFFTSTSGHAGSLGMFCAISIILFGVTTPISLLLQIITLELRTKAPASLRLRSMGPAPSLQPYLTYLGTKKTKRTSFKTKNSAVHEGIRRFYHMRS